MFKNLLLTFLLSFILQFVNAQTNKDNAGIELQKIASKIQEDTTAIGRYEADSLFTVSLVQILKQSNSFSFDFDSLVSVQKIFAPDSTFKIFTRQVDLGNANYKKRGAIQLKTTNGSLKLLPFFDKSDEFENPEYAMSSRKKWMGSIYYDILKTSYNGIDYYTLLGFDTFSETMSRKIIEVIYFEGNEPIIGGNYFDYPLDDTYPIAPIQRFVYTYKKGSNGYIRYEKETGKLILSELSSISNDLKDKSTLVPSGNEVYFIWSNGKWVMPKNYIN
jgi:acyl carrier protein